MSEIKKIVLTGGPCAGKTSALSYLCEKLSAYDVNVITVSEQATSLMRQGKTPENMGSYAFHSLLFKNQLEEENRAEALAKQSAHALILCDRGLLDSRAYVSQEEFDRYAAEHGMNEDSIRNRYDAVFHLVTAADGAEEHYNLSTNTVRSEDLSHARQIDSDLLALWTGTTHLRVIDNSTDLSGKHYRLLQEVLAVIGVPEPLEIERKFLIEYPDIKVLQSLKACRRVPITQAYMNTPEEGLFRVRKRGEGSGAAYIKTKKYKINDLKRIEIEMHISKNEYLSYLSQREYMQGIIAKDRYCFVWKNTYYELDVYPFWNDKATLEIELLHEEQSYEIPDFLTLIRDVSFEKKYRNKRLAVKYGNFFTSLL